MTLQLVFWVSALLVVYIYLGYPLLAWLGARLAPAAKSSASTADLPSVTVVIAAYNEADHIGATVRNKLDANYPEELIDVVVVSDESSDGTDEIVAGIGSRVKVLRQEPRAGKTSALNLAISQCQSEIIVFSDANSIYAPDAIARLVARFADPRVGYVTGKMVYVSEDGTLVGDGCSAYMRYENFIRKQESKSGAVIGVDGGIDAIRREEYVPMRSDQQPDFVQPLSMLEKRLAVVYEPGALLKENALSDTSSEYRMRVRVSLRALWALWDKRVLLNPFRYRLVSFRLWSHKVLRYLAFIPLALALVSNAWLAAGSVFYFVLLAVQVLFYGLAIVGHRRSEPGSVIVSLPAYFVLINIAAGHAVLRMLSGERMATWNPRAGS